MKLMERFRRMGGAAPRGATKAAPMDFPTLTQPRILPRCGAFLADGGRRTEGSDVARLTARLLDRPWCRVWFRSRQQPDLGAMMAAGRTDSVVDDRLKLVPAALHRRELL